MAGHQPFLRPGVDQDRVVIAEQNQTGTVTGCPSGRTVVSQAMRLLRSRLSARSRSPGCRSAVRFIWRRGYLVQPAARAQQVRPSVPTLFVLPREVRRTSDKRDL